MMKAPSPFALQTGYGVIERVSRDLPTYLACVAPEAWRLAGPRFAAPPARVVEADNVDRGHLIDLARSVRHVDAVVGLGGGSALDTAKFLAWQTGLPLWQFPSAASVDAAFTQPIGVREAGRVRYAGAVVPQLVAADFDLLLAAPPELNRAGVGDILSCRTGVFDWQHGQGDPRTPPLEPALVALSLRLLDELAGRAADVAAANATGITFILDAYREEAAVGDAAGHSAFEEGSEHYLAYCLEHLTGRHFVHGELVTLGVLAMTVAQDNQAASTAALVGTLGVRCLPGELGISFEALERALTALPGYCAAEAYPPSTGGGLTGEQREAVLAQLHHWERQGLPGRSRAA
jgi:glycerol-1-phosphate dehydrogenase [NAD(P)+]